ncbi:hypothetical protein LOC71_17455 [Rhodopirellula sp. JC740]|uniref:MnmC-like methyltransferase domain-containing protein n=1 Tax=Rhodopirellula halodulae TaxID=2894198 RepID=A0ABS8NKL3_9BACT|nr:MnmC family methyltransferase [Rhodopirellula sp. JC740]MCC9644072.1 hypothetical protein [Rhodopirellula sp. JC740]
MPIPNRKHLPTSLEHLEWMISDDGSRTLRDCRIDETFHGGCGAFTESIVVYLLNSGVVERLTSAKATDVLEIGLGTGTNLFLTAAIAEGTRTPVRYRVMEPELLPANFYTELRLSEHWSDPKFIQTVVSLGERAKEFRHPEFAGRLREIIEQWRDEMGRWLPLAADKQCTPVRVSLGRWTEVVLDPCPLSDVDWQAGWRDGSSCSFDAIYFDAFSPANCPELWTTSVFLEMANMLKSQGCLTTYCVKGSVRRDMQRVGFDVKKLPGPEGGKREVLIASRSSVAS